LFISSIVTFLIAIAALFWFKQEDRYLAYAPDFKTTIYHKDFGEHLSATYRLKDVSTAERFYRWIAGIRMIRDNALTGYGPNSFYYNYKSYAVPAYKTWVSNNPDRSTVHNYFLLIAIEQGLPGLLIFLALVGAMLYYVERLYKNSSDTMARTISATIGVVLVMIIVLNFLSDLIETDKVGSIFFLCLSAIIIYDRAHSMRRADHFPIN
jgi:O-antigen ligase